MSKVNTGNGKRNTIIGLSIGLLVVAAVTLVAFKSSAKKPENSPNPTPDTPAPPSPQTPANTPAPTTAVNTYTPTGKGTADNPFTDCDINHINLEQLIASGNNPPAITNGIGKYGNKPRMGG